MEEVLRNMLTEINTPANFPKVKQKAMGSMFGLMVKFTRVNGEMALKKEKAYGKVLRGIVI